MDKKVRFVKHLWSWDDKFTVGKEYEVECEIDDDIFIEDDNGTKTNIAGYCGELTTQFEWVKEEELTKKEDKALDVQVGGAHYKDMVIQPVEFTMKNNLNFCQGNVIKYICRYKHKNGLEDLKKVKHYIDLLIQLEGYEE